MAFCSKENGHYTDAMGRCKVCPARLSDIIDFRKITRFEVIDEKGRVYSNWDLATVEPSVQDQGRTLKMFIIKREGA